MYDFNLLKSYAPPVKTICVGNISTGGSGKTPMAMYLIKLLLADQVKVAYLSRGYGRKSKGIREVKKEDNFEQSGDEALLVKYYFEHIPVFVAENRVNGLNALLKVYPQTEVVILDDAFQHRRLRAGLNILLSDYNRPFFNDFIIPSGRLREHKHAIKRANILVFTKCPSQLDRTQIRSAYSRYSTQLPVFYSYIKYKGLVSAFKKNEGLAINDVKHKKSLLFSGISNDEPLVNFLRSNFAEVHSIKFPDHHAFSEGDLRKIREKYFDCGENDTIIVTTAKDFARLNDDKLKKWFESLPLYYLEIEHEFFNEEDHHFDQKIIEYVR